jgi:hypothetical protein
MNPRRAVRRGLNMVLARRGYRLSPLATAEAHDPWLSEFNDDSAPLPPDAAWHLRDDHPELEALRRAYAELDWPVCDRSRWQADAVQGWLDLRAFRGDNPFIWHYRESKRATELKYFTFLRYVLDNDRHSLVERLGEDGLFGCWTYRFPGYPACSRDLLDCVIELNFLDKHLDLLSRASVRVLDIGAGYGRLAYRTAQAVGGLEEYACTDAIPESTFLCEYYTRFRGVAPPVHVVPLTGVPDLVPGAFDVAFNVHSFSECSYRAVEWWMQRLERLRVPLLFLVPNEPDGFLTTEPDGSRLDYEELITAAGYRLVVEERVFTDRAVRELMGIDDRYCLFERTA